jgi:N-acetylglucosaminyldiphosphoundecaprenol N-acetyl-beta-D-mannosaminyltransferase
MTRERILGIPYDNFNMESVISRVEQFSRENKPRVLVHLSLPLLMTARRKKPIKMFLEEADLIVPTGRHIYRAAKLLKRPLAESIDPSVLVKKLMLQSVELGKKVYLFGGKGNTINKAYDNLKKEISKLFVIGRHTAFYNKREHADIIKAIGKASPDYFFIGMGSPAEEKWIIENHKAINAGLVVLIEGLFDLFAGNIKKGLRYKNQISEVKVKNRNIPHPHSIKKLWMVPVYVIAVFIERIFWKN